MPRHACWPKTSSGSWPTSRPRPGASRWGVRARRVARRHRTALAVSTAALLVAAVVGGSSWSVFRNRETARLATISGQVRAALDDVDRLAAQARPSSDPSVWTEAVSAAKRAEGVAATGGNTVLLRRASATRQALERTAKLLADLEAARLQGAEVRGDRFDHIGKNEAYRRAFREYGIDVSALTPEEATKRIQDAGLGAALAVTLDNWAFSTEDRGISSRLASIASRVDPDPRRIEMRTAMVGKDRPALRRLARDPELDLQPEVTVVLLGHALEQAGEHGDAVALLRRAHWRHPDDFWINHDLAMRLHNLGSPQDDAAIVHFTAALALRPNSPGVWVNFGTALHNNGRLDDTIRAYERAITLKPDYATAHYNLGTALADKGRTDDAIHAFERAIALKPDYAKAHNNLGFALKAKGRTDDAIRAYEQAVALKPDYAGAYYNLATALTAKGRTNDAILRTRAGRRARARPCQGPQ